MQSWIPDYFIRYFGQWNTILVIIGICSIVALAVFIERLFVLKHAERDTNRFILNLRPIIMQHHIVEAVRVCEETGGAISTIIKAGLTRHNRRKEEIEVGMQTAGLSVIASLEKNAKILSIIAHLTPLIGLLGTVLGFIQAFSEMRQSGLMDISTTRVGEAMEYALVTTAAGLVVAIPTVVAYNYLVSRIKSLVLDIEITSSEIVDLLTHHKETYEI